MMFKRELMPGDEIVYRNIKYKIRSITYQDFFPGRYYQNQCSQEPYIIIEFFDVNNVYRSWKSYADGGRVIYH